MFQVVLWATFILAVAFTFAYAKVRAYELGEPRSFAPKAFLTLAIVFWGLLPLAAVIALVSNG